MRDIQVYLWITNYTTRLFRRRSSSYLETEFGVNVSVEVRILMLMLDVNVSFNK